MAMLLVLTMLGNACGGDDESSPTTTERSTTTTTERDGTTSEPTEPSDDEPPTLENTGDDFVAIMESISEYQNWLFQHPDPSLVASYADPDCSCARGDQESLRRLQEQGWRARSDQTEYSSVEVVDRPLEGVVTLTAVLESLDVEVVDGEGEVVQEVSEDAPPPTRLLIALRLSDDRRWRLLSSAVQGRT